MTEDTSAGLGRLAAVAERQLVIMRLKAKKRVPEVIVLDD